MRGLRILLHEKLELKKRNKDTWRANVHTAAIQGPKCTRRTVGFRAIYL